MGFMGLMGGFMGLMTRLPFLQKTWRVQMVVSRMAAARGLLTGLVTQPGTAKT